VFSNYETGQSVNKALKESFEKLGYSIVAEIPLDSKATDFVPAMLNIRSAKPDAIVGLQIYPDILKLQRARFNLRYFEGVYVGNVGFSDGRSRSGSRGRDAAQELFRHRRLCARGEGRQNGRDRRRR
jgi:hypothetical protein